MESNSNNFEITKGRIVTAEEWYAWREAGKSNTEIGRMLGIPTTMAKIIARKFRATGVPDPQYRRTKPGPKKAFDTTTDSGGYILGVLWGTASLMGDDGFWVRHRDKWYIDIVRRYLDISAEGHSSYSHTGKQARLKIARSADVETVRKLLNDHEWSGRQAQKRDYPSGPVNNRGFIRAWVELHSSADVHRTGRKKLPTPRLRIYGNQSLLDEMNRVLASAIGLPPRSLQKTSNEITKALYFTGRSYEAVVEWLYLEAELTNFEASKKIHDPLCQLESHKISTKFLN